MLAKAQKIFILFLVISYRVSISTAGYEQTVINNLTSYLHLDSTLHADLSALTSADTCIRPLKGSAHLPLFKKYLLLESRIAHVSLAQLPTPIIECAALAHELGIGQLWVKRDDLSGKTLPTGTHLLGGNKVRKLEFLLGDALAHRARSVLTFGCAGSNHATATAMYSRAVGLQSLLMLKPQWNAHIVRRNLLLNLEAGAKLTLSPTNTLRAATTVHTVVKHKIKHGSLPYVIPTGGSCARGALGYVNAAFELKEQVAAGMLPEPDYIYVPAGSMGTLAGLALGLKATGMHSKLVGITVEPEETPGECATTLEKLFKETNNLLHEADTSFPLCIYNVDDVRFVYTCCGKDYALFTPEARAAIDVVKKSTGMQLDGVYSGKAFAGLIADSKTDLLRDKVVLFVNTFCSDSYTDSTHIVSYKELPVYFHDYFEQDVQELDRA